MVFVMADDNAEQPTRTIVLDIGEEPDYVIDALEEGSVAAISVDTIDNIETEQTRTHAYALVLTVTLYVEEDDNGLPIYEDDRLYVDRTLTLDLDDVVLGGTVIAMEDLE